MFACIQEQRRVSYAHHPSSEELFHKWLSLLHDINKGLYSRCNEMNVTNLDTRWLTSIKDIHICDNLVLFNSQKWSEGAQKTRNHTALILSTLT